MYITEKMWYDEKIKAVYIRLIWKTKDNAFTANVQRYRNGKIIAELPPDFFTYARRGEYLVATGYGYPAGHEERWKGTGEWRIDPKIRGNVRGCV